MNSVYTHVICLVSKWQSLNGCSPKMGSSASTIDTCYPANNVFCIAQGLESNQSLKKLYIENVEVEDGDEIIWSVSAETIEAIPHLLRQNKVIESIELQIY